MPERTRILVAGAGVGGLAAAIALRARGFDVEILEADPAPRVTGSGLAIHAGALSILRALAVDAGDSLGHPLRDVELRDNRGRLIRSLALRGTRAVARNELIAALAAAATDIPVHYGAAVDRFGVVGGTVVVTCSDGREFGADLLVGADGFRSAIRAQIAAVNPVNEYGYVRWLAAVPRAGLARPGVVAQYWGRGQRFGIVDLGAGDSYWWGTKRMPVEQARAWTGDGTDVLAAFDGWPAEVLDAIARTPPQSIGGVPAQDRPFLERWGDGPVTLLGDAAHPMLSSSAGFAIEDGAELATQLARAPDPVTGLRRYEDARRADARALVTRSRRLNRIEQLADPVTANVRDVVVRYAPEALLRAAPVSEFHPRLAETRAQSY